MKINQIIKTLVFIFPLITVVSCSFQENKNDSIETENAIKQDVSKDTSPVSNFSINEEELNTETNQINQNKNVVYFNLNKYEVSDSSKEILNETIDFLNKNSDTKVIIEGYTDERGTPEYNKILGEKRARSVASYLIGQGISSQRIKVVSYGENKPEKIGHDEVSYVKNRRVVLICQ